MPGNCPCLPEAVRHILPMPRGGAGTLSETEEPAS